MEPRKQSLTWRYNDKVYTAKLILTETLKVDSVGELEQPSMGLGDTIKKTIDRVTGGKVKPCKGCKKRQKALNKLMPYKGVDNG